MSIAVMAQGEQMFKLHALFGDEMVLQRGMPCAIFGFSSPGSVVTVKFLDQVVTVNTPENGKFTAYLKPLNAGGPYSLSAICGNETITFNNVYVGEVWLSSGQSNMEWPVDGSLNSEYEIENATNPMIRVIDIPTVTVEEPIIDVSAKWKIITTENVAKVSAVSYFFARDLQETLDIPIGIINSSQGGCWSESWTRWGALADGSDKVQPILKRWEEEISLYEKKYSEWETSGATDNAPKKPDVYFRPSAMWNGMIEPLIPATFRGVIWWQGEYNSEKCEQYEELLQILINDWRAQWNYPDMPFIYVQLQNYDIQNSKIARGSDARYFELRDSQLKVFKAKRKTNVGMVISVDTGHPFDIHPPNKQATGSRMALVARNMVYGEKKLQCYGPTYESFKIKNNEIIVSFSDIGKGLFLRLVGTQQGFKIAGTDQVFHEAKVRIVGKEIVVSSDKVKSPVAVRYAFEDDPVCSLYNIDGLPASPFRTDNWALFTDGKF